MKIHKGIIFSLIFFILSFINSWYSDQLVDQLTVFFYPVVYLILFIFFNLCLITSIKNLKQDSKYYYSIGLLIISVLFFLFFPFRDTKVRVELYLFENARMEIVQQIMDKELLPESSSNTIILDDKDKKLSTSGEIIVHQNDENGQIIGFWILRGMLSESLEVLYSSGGEKLIRSNELNEQIISISELKENWYYVVVE